MQQNLSYQSKTKPEVKVVLEFTEYAEESKHAESEFVSLLKKKYLEKVFKGYGQEEESALESSTTKEKEEKRHE